MPRKAPGQSPTRLKARISNHISDTMKRTAQLQGLSLTAYLIATLGENTRRAVAEADMLRLSREDQIRFAEALLDPPPPNERLARAAMRHARFVAAK